MDVEADKEYVYRLLNSPKFIKYIGDRGVRSVEQAANFIENRYRQSYRDHGYGLYAVRLIENGEPIGICGYVRRESLEGPDIGFAFLPDYERLGYGLESASAMLAYGRNTLEFATIRAITSIDNDASDHLLHKLGFQFDKLIDGDGESLKLYITEL